VGAIRVYVSKDKDYRPSASKKKNKREVSPVLQREVLEPPMKKREGKTPLSLKNIIQVESAKESVGGGGGGAN